MFLQRASIEHVVFSGPFFFPLLFQPCLVYLVDFFIDIFQGAASGGKSSDRVSRRSFVGFTSEIGSPWL